MRTESPKAEGAKAPRKPRFWDNVIGLKKARFGTQTAGWTPGPPAMSGLGCKVLADQMIPMADGVSLGSDVYLPKKDGRYPAILCFGAYTKELHAAGIPAGSNEIGNPPTFTDRGYVHVVVTRRGMGLSGGEPATFFNDQDVDDHEAVIAWAAAQPWCNGEVVLFGTSYYGCVQPQVAARKPPALKAFFTNEMCTDYFRHIMQFTGTPNLYFISLWMGANFTPGVRHLRLSPFKRSLISRILNSPLKHVWWPQLRKRIPRIMTGFMKKTPEAAVRDLWANYLVDGKTRAASDIPAGSAPVLDQIEVPFVAVQNLGYFNLHQFGTYELFEKASTPADRKWLILGEPEYFMPVYSWQEEALAFFDHVLRGSDNGYARQPRVRYWLDGAESYAAADAFPLPAATRTRLYPQPAGDDAAVHVLSDAVAAEGANRWVAIPKDAPVLGGMDERINQILTYEMAVDRETEFSGPITANLTFSSTDIDSYVLARLGRVDAAGGYHILSLGGITPARRRLDPARGSSCEIAIDTDVPEPLVPGQPVTLRFSLTPGPTRLKPGEKLRLDIGSRVDLLRSDQSHAHVHFDLQVPPYLSRNTLHCGPETWIELDRMA